VDKTFVTKVDFIYFDAGGGHRSAAIALKSVIEGLGKPWEIRLVNLQEVLHSLDVFRKVTGIRLEDIYNLMLAKGWTLGSAQGLKFMHGVIRLYHGATVRLLKRHWAETKPDMVVSLVPNFNRALRDSFPDKPYVTILTDFADYPPHFWMERQRQYVICGTKKAVEQARNLGYSEDRIFATSGMILRPRFYDPVTVDRSVELAKLGLDPQRPTGLVLFGGQGSKVMLEIAERLGDTQLILICGKNQKLAAKLRTERHKAAHYIEGFTDQIPYYMHLADFFVGKPGPGSISEAVAMKLPVIVERNAWTLPQERYNTEWVSEKEVGLVVKSFSNIAEAVGRLLQPEKFERFRSNAAAMENRALFEIPEILRGILSETQS
jgi:UDP-N-acetylglucosamine:LPS N-acetylglucosamine transferase